MNDLSIDPVPVAWCFMILGTAVFDVLVLVRGRRSRPKPTLVFRDAPGERLAYAPSDNWLVGAYIAWGMLCLILTSLLVFKAPPGWRVAYFVGWVVMPPIWYMFEHTWFYPNRGLTGSREYYEHGRLTSAALWLAGAIISFVAIQVPTTATPSVTGGFASMMPNLNPGQLFLP